MLYLMPLFGRVGREGVGGHLQDTKRFVVMHEAFLGRIFGIIPKMIGVFQGCRCRVRLWEMVMVDKELE